MSSKFVAVFALLLAAIFGIQHVDAFDDTEDSLDELFGQLDAIVENTRGVRSAQAAFRNLPTSQTLQERAIQAYSAISPDLEVIRNSNNETLQSRVRDALLEYADTYGSDIILANQLGEWTYIVSRTAQTDDINNLGPEPEPASTSRSRRSQRRR